jgi:hypothetical protein
MDSSIVTPSRRQIIVAGAAAAATVGLVAPRASALGAPAGATAPSLVRRGAPQAADATRVHRWAADTWTSLVAMTDTKTGLSADNIKESLAAGDRSGYTSPTNIGGYRRRRARPGPHQRG